MVSVVVGACICLLRFSRLNRESYSYHVCVSPRPDGQIITFDNRRFTMTPSLVVASSYCADVDSQQSNVDLRFIIKGGLHEYRLALGKRIRPTSESSVDFVSFEKGKLIASCESVKIR